MELSEEARKIRNAKARAYYATHKKQYAEANRRYWEKQAIKEAQAQKKEPVIHPKRITKAEYEVMFWIAHMCLSNKRKMNDKSLYPVKEFVSCCGFCGYTEKYAKKIYNYILEHNTFEFKPGFASICYVSGKNSQPWIDDYFVIPVSDYTEEEYQQICDECKQYA